MKEYLVVMNKSNSLLSTMLEIPSAVKAATISDLLSGNTVQVNQRKVDIQMKPFGYSIFKLNENSK